MNFPAISDVAASAARSRDAAGDSGRGETGFGDLLDSTAARALPARAGEDKPAVQSEGLRRLEAGLAELEETTRGALAAVQPPGNPEAIAAIMETVAEALAGLLGEFQQTGEAGPELAVLRDTAALLDQAEGNAAGQLLAGLGQGAAGAVLGFSQRIARLIAAPQGSVQGAGLVAGPPGGLPGTAAGVASATETAAGVDPQRAVPAPALALRPEAGEQGGKQPDGLALGARGGAESLAAALDKGGTAPTAGSASAGDGNSTATVKTLIQTALQALAQTAAPAVPGTALPSEVLRAPEAAPQLRTEVPVQQNNFARVLGEQVRRSSFSEGRTRIELAPRGLGDIEIDLRQEEAGRLRVVLRAENPAVLQAFRADRDMLLNILGDSGARVEDADLELMDFGGHGERGDTNRDDSDGGAPRVSAAGAEADRGRESGPADPGADLAEGRVDILT